MLPVTITPNAINILLDGRMRTVNKDHLNFENVKACLMALNGPNIGNSHASTLDRLRDFLDIPSFVARVTEGRVKISDNAVMFDGEEVKNIIAERLLQILRQGLDVRPLARFLDRLSDNPDFERHIQHEIYLFLESGNIPLTPDGCFLAFKKVGPAYESGHKLPDGALLYNRIGETISMPREEVDRNRYETCSRGLHFCSWQYLPNFGVVGANEDKVIIVKIAPEDVVAIPSDYNNSKGRAWKYVVIGEVPQDECQHLFYNKPVVDELGEYDGRDYGDESEEDGGLAYDEPTCGVCGETESECTGCDDEVVGCGADDEMDPNYDENLGPITNTLDEAIDETARFVAAEEEDDEPKIVFKRGRRKWTAEELLEKVADLGQRGFAKKYDIPRTTLQGWLATARQEE
jgi:hypothetical protein